MARGSSKPGGPPAQAAGTARGAARRRDWITLAALVVGVTLLAEAWQWHVARREGPALAALARPGDIRMISSVTCVYCTRAREWMTRFGVAHSECFIERDAACMRQYQALLAPGTPVLLVRGEMQLGFNAQRLLKRLAGGG